MRDVQRNKQTLYYALRTGSVENTDEYGNVTGTFREVYGEPVKYRRNVSAPKGTIDLERFGLDSQYTRVIATTDMNCPIAEDSILWVGIKPTDTKGNPVPHNYVVQRIAPTVNQLLIAIKEVHVS